MSKKWEGRWDQITGSMKKRWGKLTDDDLKQIDGNKDRLVGKLKERYGLTKEQAEKKIDDFNKDK
ncbi:CsbD family protein [Isachenkonia alkalipeptolytica]|uniref:CsbD family protein n=1 Tax=Isachenkonia alkalipeptolytica TaxID=2565777 RepID=A0AA44BE76_9CLOT|nr:CsbD family protein [Isachenkonia alkalipeptolytica]NBG87176.1 CsbD family protein [Isachenkonia alkalipeptolytica]